MTSTLAQTRARLARQDGFTLIELITVLAILGIVLSGIMAVFVAGLHAEVDMNERFQAQQEARVALATLRREVRSACVYTFASTNPGVVSADGALMGFTWVTLGYCGDSATDSTKVQTRVTWCVQADGAYYALVRQVGSSCSVASGTKWAQRLSNQAVFGLQCPPAGSPTLATTQWGQQWLCLAADGSPAAGWPSLAVDLVVDANSATKGGAYTLDDKIMFRNWAQGVAP